MLRALGVRELRYTRREDVVAYMQAWASLLEAELPDAAKVHRPDSYCEAAE